jgi:hypothetical protein
MDQHEEVVDLSDIRGKMLVACDICRRRKACLCLSIMEWPHAKIWMFCRFAAMVRDRVRDAVKGARNVPLRRREYLFEQLLGARV